MPKETTRFKLPTPEDTQAPDGPTQFKALADPIDAALARAGAQSKKTIVAGEQSRTNAAYGVMGTPDKVEKITLPADGFICISYVAQMKASVDNVGRAAIFIGANQLKTRWNGGAALVEAAVNLLAADGFHTLRSAPFGLYCSTPGVAEVDVTTGETVGCGVETQGASVEIGSEARTLLSSALGTVCVVGAAAGEYDVTVQFKSSSGSVSVRERKLRVWTQEFV